MSVFVCVCLNKAVVLVFNVTPLADGDYSKLPPDGERNGGDKDSTSTEEMTNLIGCLHCRKNQ